MSGFQVTGVYPVNRKHSKVTEEPAESLAATAGLAFTPLYSSAKLKVCSKLQGADSLTFLWMSISNLRQDMRMDMDSLVMNDITASLKCITQRKPIPCWTVLSLQIFQA